MSRRKNRNKRGNETTSNGRFISHEEYARYERFARLESSILECFVTLKENWEELVQRSYDEMLIQLTNETNDSNGDGMGIEVQEAIDAFEKIINGYQYSNRKNNKKRHNSKVIYYETNKTNNNSSIKIIDKSKKKRKIVCDVLFQKTNESPVTEEITSVNKPEKITEEMIDNIANGLYQDNSNNDYYANNDYYGGI